MFKKILKDSGLVSLGTLVSRISGLVRVIMMAGFFGTSAALEAFIVAFRLPNLFRSVLGEGFRDAVAVPMLSEHHRNEKRFNQLANNLLAISGVLLIAVSVVGAILSRPLVAITAPGFLADREKFELTVSFTRITFFYLFFIGIAVDLDSILSAMQRFFVPAGNPAFLNLSFIVGMLALAGSMKYYALIAGVMLGGIAQVVFPLFALRRAKFKIKLEPKKAFHDPEIKQMGALFAPRVGSSVVYQLNVMVDTIFSSLSQIVGSGALAAITYASTLIQFPLAMVALPLSRVTIVDFARYRSDGNFADFKKLLVFSLDGVVLLIVPVTFVFLFIPDAIIDVIFRRGAFSSHDLTVTASVFACYALGLLFFCISKLLSSAFYALQETAVPLKSAAWALGINFVLGGVLMFPLKISGVALASSVSGGYSMWYLYKKLVKRLGPLDLSGTRELFFKSCIIGLAMGLAARFAWVFTHGFNRYLAIALVCLVDCAIFAAGLFIFKFKQTQALKEFFKG